MIILEVHTVLPPGFLHLGEIFPRPRCSPPIHGFAAVGNHEPLIRCMIRTIGTYEREKQDPLWPYVTMQVFGRFLGVLIIRQPLMGLLWLLRACLERSASSSPGAAVARTGRSRPPEGFLLCHDNSYKQANMSTNNNMNICCCTDPELLRERPRGKTTCGRKTQGPGNQGEALPARSRCRLKNQRQKRQAVC